MYLSSEQRKIVNRAMPSGLFVTCGKERPNVMVTHMGALGSIWHKQIFILPVREGKLSHEILCETKSFAISVPTTDMSHEIMLCDSMSGYSVNKFEALRLRPKRAKHIPAYVLGECGLILECKVVYTASADNGFVDEMLKAEMYRGKEYHTMFFGEVVDCYAPK